MALTLAEICFMILLQFFSAGFAEKIKNEIVNYLNQKFPERRVDYLIELKNRLENVGGFESCDVKVKVLGSGVNFRGYQTFKVLVSCEDSVREFFVSALVRTFENVVIAKKDLKRGEMVNSEEKVFDLFSLEKIETTFLRNDYVCDISKILGKKLKKVVRKGEIMFESYFDEPSLVKAGESVQVIMRVGNVRVETVGIAKNEGKLNEMVRILNPKSGKLFYGKVIGEKIVIVEIEN